MLNKYTMINRIPSTWRLSPIKYLANCNESVLLESTDANYTFKYIDIGSVDYYKGICEYTEMRFEDSPSRARRIVKTGDIIISTVRTYLKSIAEITESKDVIVSTGFAVYSPNNKLVDHRYFYYSCVAESFIQEISKLSYGIAYPSINTNTLSRIKICVPSIYEQRLITKALDTESCKIVNSLTNIEKQIEILQEYKKSIIYEAVTKGIDKSVSYSSINNSWLKKVPSHWKTERLKYSFRIKKDIAGTLGYDILAVTQQGIKIKDITINSGQLASDYSKYQLVNVGDYVMNHMDLLTGFMDCSQYIGVTSPDYRVFVPTIDISRTYYTYVFQLCYLAKVFYGLGQGVSTLGRWRMPADAFNNFIIPIPPVEEQHKIAEFLNNEVSKIDTIIAEKERAIAALKEYEKSLIYEYVTGKKRVKEVVTHAD